MAYFWFKALHIIGFVAWFAELFYLVRLFVYHAEALRKPEPEKGILSAQYALMERRLMFIIGYPAMLLTLVFGTAMLIHSPALLQNPWLHVKLTLVAVLVVYQHLCIPIRKKLAAGSASVTSFQMRLFNEVPTLLLAGIVFLAVFKDLSNFLYAMLGMLGLGILLFAFARIYKTMREKKGS